MTEPRNEQGREVILVVDDEANIRDSVAVNLRMSGFDVILAGTGLEALEKIAERPDVVVLDIMLPGLDGLEVCRRMRSVSNVPILLLSARGEEIDRVVGLEVGADDYLTKPFAMRELIARVRAMLRRARMTTPPAQPEPEAPPSSGSAGRRAGEVLRTGGLEIDVDARQVTFAGRDLQLKPKEFDLLTYLVRHPGVVMSRDALLREVWGYNYRVDTRTVDVHMRWLRQKLEPDPAVPVMLLTVHGRGYRFQPMIAEG